MTISTECLESEDETLCERCNEWVEEVAAVPFQDGSGYWNLCEDCARDVAKNGEDDETV